MSTKQLIFDRLWSTPHGQCFVHNLLDSLDLGTIDRATVRNALDVCVDHMRVTPLAEPLDELPQIVSKLHGYVASPVRPTILPDFLATNFEAKYAVTTLRLQSDYRLKSLATAITEFDRIAIGGNRHKLAQKERRIHQIIESISGGSANGLCNLDIRTALLGSSKHFGWWTSYDDGDEERGCWPHQPAWQLRGDATRDILGLVHYGSSTHSATPGWKPTLLATYVVPSTAIGASTRYGRPNAFDALGGTRFKARFGNARGPTSQWGRTVNLAKLYGTRPHRGGREIVIENSTPIVSVRFTVSGSVWVPRADFRGVRDAEFEAIVRGKRTKDSQERRFMSL